MNGHPERLSEAEAAREAAELRYRQLVQKGGAVRKITLESKNLKKKNHFSEAIESLLREGAQKRAHGR